VPWRFALGTRSSTGAAQRYNADVPPLDRRKRIRLVEDWYGMNSTQGIIVEAVASEFVRPAGGV